MEYSEHFSEVFKTIPTDNGSEFARLSELEELTDTLVYFAHWECDLVIGQKTGVLRSPVHVL